MLERTYNIQIKESGEDLYIKVFAESKNIRDNKVLYYECSEFLPDDHDNFITENEGSSFIQSLYFGDRPYEWGRIWKRIPHNIFYFINSRMRTFYYRILKQRYIVFKIAVKNLGLPWKHSYFWNVYNIMKRLTLPIIAIDQFEERFSVNGQLSITGLDSGLTNTYYLKSSQNYLKERLNELIQGDEYRIIGTEKHKIANEFVNWRQKHLDLGHEIFYISELNT